MFDNNSLYRTDDPKLLALAPYSTWAHWRSEGRGPTFLKVGARVFYRGADLNAWLDARTVEPTIDGGIRTEVRRRQDSAGKADNSHPYETRHGAR